MKAPFVLCSAHTHGTAGNGGLSSEAWLQLSCHLPLISAVPGEG